tara:strand:+ start:6188 stop:6541 length:354 start_codon:yes stop_codon:yes gene_type:complete
MSEQKKLPSMGQMLKNFAKDVAEYAKAGAPHVSKKQYNYRLKTCDECEHLRKEAMRCGECGCLVEHKAKWATSNCPKKKWPQVLIGKDGKKVKVGRGAAKKQRQSAQTNHTKTGDKA